MLPESKMMLWYTWVVREVMQTRISQCNPLADSDAHGAVLYGAQEHG